MEHMLVYTHNKNTFEQSFANVINIEITQVIDIIQQETISNYPKICKIYTFLFTIFYIPIDISLTRINRNTDRYDVAVTFHAKNMDGPWLYSPWPCHGPWTRLGQGY